jgi:tetratricopeptide (TPR) repeat protein
MGPPFFLQVTMDSPDAGSAALSIDAELTKIRALLQGDKFADALAAGKALLARAPAQREALLLTAIAQRFLGRIADALDTLATLEQHHPRFSRLHEERGHCFVFLRQAEAAVGAFSVAVGLNYALPNSWSMLEGLYRMTGKAEDRKAAAGQVASLRNLPSEVITATGLFADGDIDQAERMIRSFLLSHGNDIEAMRLLARIGIARKVFDDPEILLAAILEIAPDYHVARAEYAEVLIELHKYDQARAQLERLMREDPAHRSYLQNLYAVAVVGLGDHARAIGLYRELLQGTAADADLHLSIAHALKTLGSRDDAVASYRQAARVRPGFGDAYWSLANLKTYRFTDEELGEMKAFHVDSSLAPTDRHHLCFALAKASEDRGEFAESFHYYEQGNALKREESNYRPELIERNTRQQIEICAPDLFVRMQGAGAPDPDPIFIVGLPRSGSTLLEQILASHSQVEGTQELPNVQQMANNLRGRDPDPSNPRYPRILTEMAPEELRALGEKYLADTRIYRTGKPYFIDKMPNNFRHLGLIRLMLPNAKIIDARREPLACCFSNLKQLFAKGQEFTYSVDDIARYYRTYLELMRHWDGVLPGWVLRVHHEDVVDDLESQVRRILKFCGLPFEPACMEFHQTTRSVRTASSEQVRQPINRDGMDQWKNFDTWLGPLKLALGDALTHYRE